jgi:hypothetical protein
LRDEKSRCIFIAVPLLCLKKYIENRDYTMFAADLEHTYEISTKQFSFPRVKNFELGEAVNI